MIYDIFDRKWRNKPVPIFGGVTGRVYYKAWRVPAPRSAAVVFLHGFGEHSGLYHRLGNALNNAGIELWALDEIGHGLTEGDRAVIRSIDDLVQNGRRLTAIAEAVQPGRPVWLAGHSLGAVAAAVAAAREPRRYAGLILSGAALSPLDWVLALGDDDAEELALDPADLSSDPFYLDELAYDPLAFTSAAGALTLATVLPPAWDELAGAFGQVTLSVLFVHGSEDQVVPVAHARAWSGRLAGARLAEFPGARHDILNETVHREVAAAITEFVLHADPDSAAVRPTVSGHPLPATQPAH
jgi:alpha-beta hydrolase superfamily lysophospholipase